MTNKKYSRITNSTIVFIILFFTCILLHAQDSNSLFNKTDDLISSGRFNEAIKLLEDSEIKSGENYLLHFKLGLAFKGLFQFDKAKIEFEKADRLSPENPEVLYALGICYKSLDLFEDAERVLRKATEISERNVTAAVDLGNILMILNRYDSAAAVYEKLISRDSTNSFFYKQLGNCLVKTNNLEGAAGNYEKALIYNPGDAGTIARLAQIFFKKEMLDTAAVIAEKGLAVQRMNPDLNKIAAEIYFKKNNYFGAVKHLLNIIVAGDSTAPVYQKLGLSYYLSATSGSFPDEKEKYKKLNEAINALNKAFEKDSEQALTQFYLGISYKELSDFENAVNHLSKAVSLAFPDYLDDIYTHLGISYEQNKNYPLAIENFQKALKENPLKKNILFYLASLYDKYYSDKSVALIYYKKFIKEAEEADPKLLSYSEQRIEKLNETIHFNNK